MSKYIFLSFWLFFLLYSINGFCQTIPPQYIEYVNETFERKSYLEKYRLGSEKTYQIKQRSSRNQSLNLTPLDSVHTSFFTIDSFMLGDFVLFLDLNLPEQKNCQSDFKLIFTEREGDYYQLQLENSGNTLKLGLQIVLDTNSIQLEEIEIDNSFLLDDPWTKLALSRNIVDGSIDIFLHKSKTPVLEIKNRQLVLGGIKILVEKCSISIDNLKIYAPTIIKKYE